VKAAKLSFAGLIALASTPVGAKECIAPKPPKISGELCGRLIDATRAGVPNAGLQVQGDSGRTVAAGVADAMVPEFRQETLAPLRSGLSSRAMRLLAKRTISRSRELLSAGEYPCCGQEAGSSTLGRNDAKYRIGMTEFKVGMTELR